jgi:hypothetical protein
MQVIDDADTASQLRRNGAWVRLIVGRGPEGPALPRERTAGRSALAQNSSCLTNMV